MTYCMCITRKLYIYIYILFKCTRCILYEASYMYTCTGQYVMYDMRDESTLRFRWRFFTRFWYAASPRELFVALCEVKFDCHEK